MTILLDRTTPVLVLGITGKIGSFHTQEMIAYGTNIVGGVTPGKGGSSINNVPVFDTVKEAAEAGLKLCVAITDGIPAKDMIRVKRYMRRYRQENRMQLVGPNCAGIVSPGKSLLGIMPGHIYLPGHIGVVGRSGTLGYEAASQMKELGIGISTSVGIGGDPINGSSFRDILELFEADRDTRAVMMIGEIGGPQEAEAAQFIKE